MAVADNWEHTWRSGMIVSNAGDDDVEGEPVLGLSTRVGLLVMVGLVAASALTAHVRLHVLRAEQRRLVQEMADTKAATELTRCQVAARSAKAVIAAKAMEEGLRPPASIGEIGSPTLAPGDGDSAGNGVGSELRHLSRATVQNTAHRLGAILRGPPAGR